MVTVNGQKFNNNQVDKILLAEGIAELFPSINWGERLRIIQHLGRFYSYVLTDRISKDALATPLANIPRLVKNITAIVSVPKMVFHLEEPVQEKPDNMQEIKQLIGKTKTELSNTTIYKDKFLHEDILRIIQKMAVEMDRIVECIS